MDIHTKLSILADAAKYDASCASSGSRGRRAGPGGIGHTDGIGILPQLHARWPLCVAAQAAAHELLHLDCAYCINRRSSGVRRARSRLTTSSGSRWSSTATTSKGFPQLRDHSRLRLHDGTARHCRPALAPDPRLRRIIHLKTIPTPRGTHPRGGTWADRLSINVELPRQSDLDALAPEKELSRSAGRWGSCGGNRRGEETPRRASVVRRAGRRGLEMIVARPTRPTPPFSTRPARCTVASKTSPGLLLRLQSHPRRVTRLPPTRRRCSGAPPLSGRLAHALLRVRGGRADDDRHPEPRARQRPKLAWALRNRDRFPVDVNRADRRELMRSRGSGSGT